ncbi:MAG: hypothetical protein E5Y65_28235 [Mesorhizobium sp.]|uniref:hypothetical protein n=1 Tax=Mesorhizobium sp. TaxID=1871066 RepID=UPI00122AE1B2|nr:hypothetical protein [Mesorhizobium sp.]TIL72865.1 MAG: hypothetical protein E5Y70_19670 [Mesorhizobium sp.]TIL85978.1 MAG: hypothetical protein E5Y65_28235 [Mesorhizobium sp.]TIM01908.1 MAG: hypothetical protein E5Y64_10135 [Mesorhizobium sp.]
MSDNETLLGVSSVYLFGRLLEDVTLKGGDTYGNLPRPGNNNFLRRQLEHVAGPAEKEHPDACLARIFSFSFEGAFYELAPPAIFLVHGAGLDPDDPPPTDADNEVAYKRLSRVPGSSARTGLGFQIGAFSKDMKVWIYDKSDHSLRLDAETGSLEQILLSGEAHGGGMGRSGGGMGRSGGVMGRSGGSMGRSGGVMARSSGWTPRKPGDLD